MVEYNMSATLAKEILKTRQGSKQKPQEYLIKYVQEQFGIKDLVVKISSTL